MNAIRAPREAEYRCGLANLGCIFECGDESKAKNFTLQQQLRLASTMSQKRLHIFMY